jgi:glutaminyl-tRNA synthetase
MQLFDLTFRIICQDDFDRPQHGEPALAEARPEERYQFERLGYFALDPDSTPEKQVWNRTITLKDTWAKEAKK